MLAVAELMSDEQTGYMVQTTQADIVLRLADLIAVLEEELERRRDAEIEEACREYGITLVHTKLRLFHH